MDGLADGKRCKGVKQRPSPFPPAREVNLITLRLWMSRQLLQSGWSTRAGRGAGVTGVNRVEVAAEL